jgi:hypothetical protein
MKTHNEIIAAREQLRLVMTNPNLDEFERRTAQAVDYALHWVLNKRDENATTPKDWAHIAAHMLRKEARGEK